MIYLWITYNSLMMYLWFTYDLLMITYVHLLYLWFTNVMDRYRSAQPYSRAIHSGLLAGSPLEGSAVDVPPSIAVTTVLLRVAGCARKVWSLIAHGERDGSSFTHRHKSQPPQDWSYGNDIQDLWLHLAFVNDWVFLQHWDECTRVPLQPYVCLGFDLKQEKYLAEPNVIQVVMQAFVVHDL